MIDQSEMKHAVLKAVRSGLDNLVEEMRFEEITHCWCGGSLEPWLPHFEPYSRCADCGCKGVQFQPTAESLKNFYSKRYWYEYQTVHECPPLHERYESDMMDRVPTYLDWIRQLRTAPGRILEIGCGNGRLLHELSFRAYDCEAAEMDPDIAAWVTSKTGITVYAGSFPPEESRGYDLILLIDVLEHIQDQIQFVEKVRIRLDPGGRVMVHCPVIDSVEQANQLRYLFNPISHLWMHTSRSIELLWARVGLQPTRIGDLFGMPGLEFSACKLSD